MTTAITIAALVATGVQAYGQYQQGKQAQAQAKAQAAWNLYNAKVAKRNEEAQARANLFESQQAKRRADELMGKFRARRGAARVTGEGSPLLAEEDLAAQWAKEQTNIRLTGEARARAFRSQSILDVSKASAAKSRAAGFGQAAVTRAGTTLLQGAAQTGYMGYQMGAWSGGAGTSSGFRYTTPPRGTSIPR